MFKQRILIVSVLVVLALTSLSLVVAQEAYYAGTRTWTGTWTGTSDPEDFRKVAAEWLGLGVAIIGGCCRIGPAHIAHLRRLVDSQP